MTTLDSRLQALEVAMASIRIALLQESLTADVSDNVEATIDSVRIAAGQGAQIVCLQELFAWRYFPQAIDPRHRELAEPIPSPLSKRMAALARELGVALVVPLFELDGATPYNTALLYGPDGAALGKYRKNHIPEAPGYHERHYFAPGNVGYPVYETLGMRLGIGICWDQWFPEVARLFALDGAQLLLYPSAIGSEPERPGYSSLEAWRTVLRSHAITNGVFVAAVNRVGVEQTMSFYGGSLIIDPFGEVIAEAGDEEEILVTTLDLGRIEEFRSLMHCFRDRRPETYAGLTTGSLAGE